MASILLLASDRERTRLVRGLLRKDGHRVTHLRSIDDWRTLEREMRPEVVVAAVESTEVVLSVRGRPARGFPAPLLFVQHDADFCRDVHLEERLVDRITSPFMGEDLLGRVDALVRVRRVIHKDPSVPGADRKRPRLADTRSWSSRLGDLLNSPIPRIEKPLAAYLEVAARVAEWADRRDAFEPGHAERVTSFCAMIADALRLGDRETGALLRAAMLHDIGKVAMPVEVLHQREPLAESQMRLIRTHPRRGAALLDALDRDDDVAKTILYHHERPDGAGYYRVEWEKVPRTAKILAVSEVFDALTSSKLRQPLSSQSALERLENSKGRSLDSDCVEALVDKLRPPPRTIPLAPRPRIMR